MLITFFSSISPYTNATFFSFFVVLIRRLFSLFHVVKTGLYIDELQILVFISLSWSGAIIGSFLLLKRMMMFANAISHTILFGLVIVALFSGDILHLSIFNLIISSVITTIFTGLLIRTISDFFHIKEDASIAFIFSFLFALSLILLVYLSKSTHVGTELVLGNADALTIKDLQYVSYVLLINLLIVTFLFRGFLIYSFDVLYSKALGFSPTLFGYILLLQTSLSLVSAFKAVGVLLSLSFLIIPVITAKLFAKSVKWLIFLSMIFGCLGSILGTALSRHVLTQIGVGLSSGGLISLVLIFIYSCAFFLNYLRNFFIRSRKLREN